MNLGARSLCGYGKKVLKRDNYTCQYCGFDGRSFDNWLQMSIDHIKPRSAGGGDEIGNLVAACKACNSFSSRFDRQIGQDWSLNKILSYKKEHILKRRKEYLDYWQQNIQSK